MTKSQVIVELTADSWRYRVKSEHVLTECVLVLWLRGYVFVVGMEGVQTRNQDVGAGGVKWRKAEIVDKSLIFSL